MVKLIKGLDLQVQAEIMDHRVRITGKTKDDLQAVITRMREHGPDTPHQFTIFA